LVPVKAGRLKGTPRNTLASCWWSESSAGVWLRSEESAIGAACFTASDSRATSFTFYYF